MTVSSIAAVSPDPRKSSVSSLAVVFSLPINTSSLVPGAITLTDNGQSISTSGLSLTLASGATYEINGLSSLTTAEGTYTLTINAADVKDTYGNPGSGTVADLLVDGYDRTHEHGQCTARRRRPRPPSRSRSRRPTRMVLTAARPRESPQSPFYDSTNGGAFALFTTVSPSTPMATFTGQAGDTYGFYSVATDAAGNVQPTPGAPSRRSRSCRR